MGLQGDRHEIALKKVGGQNLSKEGIEWRLRLLQQIQELLVEVEIPRERAVEPNFLQ